MKSFITIFLFVFASANLDAQESLSFLKHIYIGSEVGVVSGFNNTTSTITEGNVTTSNTFLSKPKGQYDFLAGYQIKRHSIEIGFQVSQSFIGFDCNAQNKASKNLDKTSVLKDREFQNLSIRYAYSLSNLENKIRLKANVGVGLVHINHSAGGEFSHHSGGLIGDSTSTKLNYQGNEAPYKTQTIAFDGGLSLESNLTQHLVFNIWSRYTFSPWNVRTEHFTVQSESIAGSTVTTSPAQTGTAQSNLNSIGLGMGLRCFF